MSKHAPLSTRTKALYGLGSIAFGAKGAILGLLLLYYNQIVGLPAEWVSLALAISIVVDAVWDPLIGQVSDGLRTKWGRRHPFMYVSALPVAVSFVLLWNPPQGWADAALFGYLLTMILIVRLTTSFYEVPSTALAPELAPAYHERTMLLSYRYLFSTIGGVLASILAFGVFLRATPEHAMGQLNPAGYGPLAVSVALLMVASILISTAGTHHTIPRLHQPPERKVRLKEALGEVAATLTNWNFGVAVVAGLIAGTAAGLMAGLQIYLSTYFWELPSANILVLVLMGLISTPVAILTARWLSARWGKRMACMSLFMLTAVSHCLPIFLRLVGLFPDNGSPVLLPLLTLERVVSGTLGIGGFILSSSMVADIVEESQLKTGRRSEGLLLSADSVLQKVISGFATILPGLILAFIDFPEKAKPGAVAPDILAQLGWIYMPIVFVLVMISAYTWSFYRIDQAEHERHLETIDEVAAAENLAEAVSAPAAGPAPVSSQT